MLTQLTQTSVPWERQPIVARREGALHGLTWPAISLTGTLIGLVVVFAWIANTREGSGPMPFFVLLFFGIGVLSSSTVIGYGLFKVIRAQQELGSVGDGVAFQIDRQGITTPQGKAPWDDIISITTVPGQPCQGPILRVEHRLGCDSYPVDALGVLPGSLESAVRIFSRGRHGVDLSAIED